jgi:hypothetical protein
LNAVWRRHREVYLTQGAASNETLLGSGEQPVISVGRQGPVAAWITHRPGDLMVMLPRKTAAINIASDAIEPVVVSLDDTAVVAWETKENGRPQVKIKRINPAGWPAADSR